MASAESVSQKAGKDSLVARLTVVSYERLLRKEPTEQTKLLSACCDWGFFYLDLGGIQTNDYLETVASLFAVSKEYFAKPLEEKLTDTRKELDVYNICG